MLHMHKMCNCKAGFGTRQEEEAAHREAGGGFNMLIFEAF